MGNLIFITGGVRSGKSAFAIQYAKEISERKQMKNYYYIVSGVAFDEEMAKRIQRHQYDRTLGNINWKTIEVIDNIPEFVNSFTKEDIVIWDCITTWLSNILFHATEIQNKDYVINRLEQLKTKISEWKKRGVSVIIVSNEIFDEEKSKFFEVNFYRQTLGELHQWFVEMCDEAFELDYGVCKKWKGTINC